MQSPAKRLRELLNGPDFLTMPCCFDALSARLIEQAGFPLTFMSGFAVSATRLAAPDTGLISFAEMVDQGRDICDSVSLPVIGDGDTGYGNPANVNRTVHGYARAGFAGIMIEDQLAPKRCGHTQGKEVVTRREALQRMQAAVDARDEGAEILIMARTDARATHGHIDPAYGDRQPLANRPPANGYACANDDAPFDSAACRPISGRRLDPSRRRNGDGLCAGWHLPDGERRE